MEEHIQSERITSKLAAMFHIPALQGAPLDAILFRDRRREELA